MRKKYQNYISFQREVQPHLLSFEKLHSKVFDLNIVRTMLVTKEGSSVLLDLVNPLHDVKIFQTQQPHSLLKLINQLIPIQNRSQYYHFDLFSCQVHVQIDGKLILIVVIKSDNLEKRGHHLMKFWMKHLFTQLDSEFTPKLLRADIPSYEENYPDKFLYYQEIFQLYSELDLSKINTNFNSYMRKILTTTLPYSKARYLLCRMLIYECESKELILDHSFVKDTARNIDFLNSKHFQEIMARVDNQKKKDKRQDILQNLRRRSVLSNYNNRTYNKDPLQELYFGQFTLKVSTFKTPLDQEYKIALVFEKNLRRKQKLDKKTFSRYSKKLNRRYEEQNNRNDKYFQAVDFFRFMFDFKRSHPFAQFVNKQDLNDIKAKARAMMIANNNTNSPINIYAQRRRKFGSEMVPFNLTEKRLLGSFKLNREGSSKDQTGIGTKMSNGHSHYSILNIKQLQEDKTSNSALQQGEDQVMSSSQSSSSSSSSVSDEHEQSNDADSSFTLNLLQGTFQLPNMSKDLLSFNHDKRQVLCGTSLRALMNNDALQSMESLSVNNPVSDENNVELDLNEYRNSLYDMINGSIVTISSIQEFDKAKDWLSKQVVYDSSGESDNQETLRDLVTKIQVGIPTTGSQYRQQFQRPSIVITSSSSLLQIPQQKRPSIRVNSVMGQNDMKMLAVEQPRRHSMRGNIINQNLHIMEQSPLVPTKSVKRTSFRLMDNNFDISSPYPETPSKFIRGIIENVREEQEEDGEDQEEVKKINEQSEKSEESQSQKSVKVDTKEKSV